MVEVNGRGIEDVDRFVYLGATVSKEGGGTEDRVVKARGVFLRLKSIWSSHSISRRTKVRPYTTLVKPVLMYGCETWKMNKCDENKIVLILRTLIHKLALRDKRDVSPSPASATRFIRNKV